MTSDIYTPFSTAVSLALSRRQSTATLPCDPLARRLAERPHAVLFRQVATPNFELRLFARLAAAAGFEPLILEYHRDKFVTRNHEKLALAKMSFYDGLGRNGGPRLRSATVARLPEIDGVRFDAVATSWGQGLIDFHHDLLNYFPPLAAIERCEASNWFSRHGGAAATYYRDLLGLFSNGSILFECFWTVGEEGAFLNQIVKPAFVAAARCAPRPLVCRLYPERFDESSHWSRYPLELEPVVRAHLEQAPSASGYLSGSRACP